ncbi:solute carrier organic anion transporter family member 4A1-like isoform X1 [Mytilus galloprovincialis]|uniref:solute carrier organic anion transporter family member 4A1-like isoform X1 n=1 Tax=Mytilus galloprovincialis TaxID=29158 RepID=UPI003F7C3E87
MVANQNEDRRYGCGPIKFSCTQRLNSIRWHVFWQCIFTFFDGFIVSGVVNVIIPALEKRYELSSSKSAIIVSANDFGAFVLLIFLGYFGERRHKPKLMGAGILLMAFGCLVFSLPQFIGEKYAYTISDSSKNGSDNLCSTRNKTSSCSSDVGEIKEYYKVYYALFIVGQMLLGIGAVPMFTIGLSYIDENCKQKLTSFYIGLTLCSDAVGVATGYIVGGSFLNVFVDVDKLDVANLPLTSSDPQWVGAWWIGFIIAVPAFILVAFPILGYPRRLPGYEELQNQRKSEAYDNDAEEIIAQASFGKNLKDFPRSFQLLIKNPTYVFLCLGSVCETLLIGGTATFVSKIIQEFFNVDLATAGTIIGAITIPGSGGGMIFGGYMVKRLNLKLRGIIYFCCISIGLAALLGPIFLSSCPSQPLAGVSTDYKVEIGTSLIAGCNNDCGCTTAGFEPICDQNKTVYFSPCYAGCTKAIITNGTKSYMNCDCISSAQNTALAVSGACSDKCNWFYVFCVLFFLIMWFTFSTMSPILTAIFRCVPHDQRSFAISLQVLLVRLLGTTPGPIFLGAIIDSSCDVWQNTCGKRGSCWIYNKTDLGLRIMVWWICLKVFGLIFLFLAAKVYKPRRESTELKVSQPESVKAQNKLDREKEFTKL